IEAAFAIIEKAFLRSQIDDFTALQVKRTNGCNGITYFLTVRAHVLHRASPDGSRNAAHTFDSRVPSRNRMGDEAVPIFLGANIEEIITLCDPLAADVQHQSTPSC